MRNKRTVPRASPVRLVLILAVSILVTEALVMLVLSYLPPLSVPVGALVDSTSLVVLVSPMLYLFLFRPMATRISERERAEGALGPSLEATTRSQRLLLALSQAAEAVQRAGTRDEVYRAVGDEVVRLGHHAMVFTVSADREHLEVSHVTFDSTLLRAAEKLAGVSAQGYRFPLVPGSFYQRIIAEEKTVFPEQVAEWIGEALPGAARPLAGRIAAMLGLERVILAPLMVGGDIYGLLAVSGIGVTESDMPAVTTFANQTSIALENVRLYQETLERAERLAALNEIAGALASSLDIETVFPRVVDAMKRLVAFDRAHVGLLDAEGTMTIFALRTEAADSELGRGVQVAAPPPVLEVRRTRRGIVRNDLEGSDHPFDRALVREGIRSTVVAPLISRGQVIGVCTLGSREPGAYSEEHLALLQTVAEQIAPAVENARLYVEIRRSAAELERRVAELSAMNAIAAIVNESLDEDEILNRALDEALRQVGVEAAGMLLLDEEAGELTLVAHRRLSDAFAKAASRIKLGEGLAGRAAQTGQPVVMARLDEYPGALKAYVEQDRIQSVASVPLLGRSGVIGVMNLATDHPDYFDAAGMELLVSLGRQIAIGVEKARLHEAVLESEEKLRLALDVTRDEYSMVISTTMEGFLIADTEGRFLDTNEAYCRMLGYSRREMLEMRIQDVEVEESSEETAKHMQNIMERGYDRFETRHRRKDGRILDIDISTNFVKGNGGRFFAFMRDITEHKQAQEALRRAHDELEARVRERTAQLERSNRELQDFAYIASHDLQEPLRKIQAFTDRLQARDAEALDEQGRDYLLRTHRAAQRMQRLVNDLLTYSRVTTQAQSSVPVDLAEVARGVMSDLELQIERIGAQIEVGDLPTIDSGPTQMQQLLQNLVGNALKFHRDDVPPVVRISGAILSGQEQAPADASSDGAHCQIVVEDNGIGFDEKYLDRIFQPFQRLHGRAEYEGSGIGLAVCRKIVEYYRGSITARSTPGHGTTFIVTLPVRQVEGD